MTSSVGRGAIDLRDDRTLGGLHSPDLGRVVARLWRALWMRDRAVAEARWAAITLATMAALSLLAKAIDPADSNFHVALVLTPVAAGIAALVGWTRAGNRLVQRSLVRLLLGPAVLFVAAICAGGVDLTTLAMPPAGPFMILALTFAAVTRSFPVTAALLLLWFALVGISHAVLASQGLVAGDLVSDEYVVRVAVAFSAALGLAVVVRIATTAEERAMRLAARSRRRLDDFETLERIVRRFDGSRSVREVIQGVVDDVSREFEIALVSIYLPDAGRLSMVGVAGYHTPFHVIDLGVGVIGRAGTTQQTQFVADVLADPDYRAARDDVRNEVAAPIVHDGELLGVINFEGTLRKPLGTAHVALAEMLARTIAAALRTARLDEERQERLHALERVLAVSRGLLSDLDRRRTIEAVVDAATDLLGAERVLVAGRGHDGQLRVEGDSTDPHDGTWRSRWLDPTDDAEALEAVATGDAVLRSNDGRAVLAVPIPVDGDVAAVLIATREAAAPCFSATDRSIGELLATQVGVALHNADRHATVSDAAVRDPLTGLLNRRYFDEAAQAAFATARRTGAPLSLIVLDLDRFSAVNNEHGHAVGDAVLRRVALALRDQVRVGDTVARYGGEEFVVIAPGAETEEAVAVAERVRAAIATLDPEVGGVTVPITISAGVASLLGDELDGQALFRAADSALLTAKRAGRDRVVAV